MTDLAHLENRPPDDAADRLKNAIVSSIGGRFVGGNTIEALHNGDEIFPAMLEAVEAARESIDFVTFVYWTGDIARKFANLLAEKARSGVRVRVILDGFGSQPMKRHLIETMTASGVSVERFRPIVRWKVWESDHRTHRKILIIDNQIGFTGGVGIAEEWEGDARNPNEWRDTHFRIEGPAVLGLRAAFLTDWRDCGHAIDASDATASPPEEVGDVAMAVIDGSAQIGYNDAERALEGILAVAEQRILIQTPYLNPTDAVCRLLEEAARRGVDVDILIPGPHIDKRVSLVAAEEAYIPLVTAGIRVWIYQPTMMHVKAVMVDGILSLIGSVNINRRSIAKDEEVAIAVLDRDLTALLEKRFQDDVHHSTAAGPQIPERPLARKLAAKILRPMKNEL